MYKLSIIIPIYNVERYIKDTIESVLKQITDDIEVVLVNDGSTDDSLKICKAYQTKKGVNLLNKSNGGLSDARNYGINNCNGKYILFLDGDDLIEDNSLEYIISTINEHDNIDVIIGDRMKLYFEDRNILELKCGFEEAEINGKDAKKVLGYFLNKPKFNNWSACSNIYNKEFLINNNLYFKKGIFYEDAEWTPRVILTANKFALINKNFYIYRRDRIDSIMNSVSLKKINDFINICDEWINYINNIDCSLELKEIVILKYVRALESLLPKLYYLNKKDKKIIKDKINKWNNGNYLGYKKSKILNRYFKWDKIAYLIFLKILLKSKMSTIINYSRIKNF